MTITIQDFDAYFNARDKLYKGIEKLIIKKGLVGKDEKFVFDAGFNASECKMHICLYRGIPGANIDGYDYEFEMNELLFIEI